VHGKGVFAVQPIARGEKVIEYVGEVITWKEADRRHPHDPKDPNHTFYFHLDDKHVLDALYGGNSSRWINHACEPNCEADVEDKRVFIKALRDIQPGEELNYDYGLVIDSPLTPELKAEYACWCGAPSCRGTMLASRRRREKIAKRTKRKRTKSARSPKTSAANNGASPNQPSKAKAHVGVAPLERPGGASPHEPACAAFAPHAWRRGGGANRLHQQRADAPRTMGATTRPPCWWPCRKPRAGGAWAGFGSLMPAPG
jgi:uncharacterized protein